MIKGVNSKDFKRFGHIIEHPDKEFNDTGENMFHIVCTEEAGVGWRIAYLITRDTMIERLEQHPDSLESFEPVSGETLLYVSDEKDLNGIVCFYLNKPVVLHKGTWHGVVTLSDESEIKITENAKVETHIWPLAAVLSGDGKVDIEAGPPIAQDVQPQRKMGR